MSRKICFLLSIITIFFFFNKVCNIGDAYGGQTATGKETSRKAIPHEKLTTIDEKQKKNDLPATEDASTEKQKQQSVIDTSPEIKGIYPSNGIVKEQDREEKGRDIMEEALELLNESRDYWVKGDLENALDLLDQAYALLLDTNGEPDISRQKDDIRLLISKQLLSIYSSMHTTTIGKRSEIPHIVNSDIEKEIRLFQTVEKDFFIQSYGRSGLYRPVILRELKKAGLPEELSWLPLVESGFKIHALSRARALGLWQFIPSTGYKYGLNRDEWIDERMDVEKSTRAAIDYLKELHGMFGDWLTVLAAYNCGEGRVLKVISRQHINYFDRFWDLYHQLPHETARYVPRFLATLQIIRNPQKYGIDLNKGSEKQAPYRYEIIKTNKSMRLQDIAHHLGASEDILVSLNSELRQKITPDKEYNLKVPPDMTVKFAKVVEAIPRCEKPRQVFVNYKAKRGETVVSIARKFKTSVSAIMTYNKISGRKKIKSGQRLIIPIQGSNYAKVKSTQRTYNSNIQENGELIKYKVKKSDTLSSIAKNFDTTVDEIKRLNNFKKRKTLKRGQIIMISSKKAEKRQGHNADKEPPKKIGKKGKEAVTKTVEKKYTVQKGDNLGKIAKKNGVSINKILEINKLAREDNIHPGQVIIVK